MIVLGRLSVRHIMDDDFDTITLPGSILLERSNDDIDTDADADTPSPRALIAQNMENFRKRAADPFLDIIRTFCQNRCRVRRTLCHMIGEWEVLQLDAENIDQEIQLHTGETALRYVSLNDGPEIAAPPLPLSSWTYLYKVRQMEWIVQFGFELEVYQPDELAGMYWYLNYLSKARVQHVDRIKAFILRALDDAQKNTQTYPDKVNEFSRCLSYMRLAMLDASVTWELAEALSNLYLVLARLELIPCPGRPYSSDELRYDVRMKPFALIGSPPLPSFAEYKDATMQSDLSSAEILDDAELALGGAKRGLELMTKFDQFQAFSQLAHARWQGMAKNWLRSAIMTGIAISAVCKALERVEKGEKLGIKAEVPVPGDAYHEWWIVPKIVAVK